MGRLSPEMQAVVDSARRTIAEAHVSVLPSDSELVARDIACSSAPALCRERVRGCAWPACEKVRA